MIQIEKIINPNEQSKSEIPFTAEEDSYKATFNNSNTGKKFVLFAKVANSEFQKAIQPYMLDLAIKAGLITK